MYNRKYLYFTAYPNPLITTESCLSVASVLNTSSSCPVVSQCTSVTDRQKNRRTELPQQICRILSHLAHLC